MDNSRIEWTDATWNPTIGCTRVSPGCDNCYAISVSHRFSGQPGAYEGVTARVPVSDGSERSDWTGRLNLIESRLDQPLRWSRPRRIFVNSMSDLFHDQVPDEFIARVFAVMAVATQHTFQILTKRHGRMRSLLNSPSFQEQVYVEVISLNRGADLPVWPFANVWLGVSVEDQKRAELRVPALVDTPAAVRFLSCEPLLGSVRLSPLDANPPAIDWVIVGGESGHGARPMSPRWARSLRDECADFEIPFLFKQWGNWAPAPYKIAVDLQHPNNTVDEQKRIIEASGATHVVNDMGYVHEMQHKPWSVERNDTCPPEWEALRHFRQKHDAGRHLDGELHDAMPELATS